VVSKDSSDVSGAQLGIEPASPRSAVQGLARLYVQNFREFPFSRHFGA
jgi:hypothetical protein